MNSKSAKIKKRCFVVCPIGEEGGSTRLHADWLFEGIIVPTFDRNFADEYEVIRSDKIDTPGMIDAQIINLLVDVELVIADMSELNANAFYELGIRHMAQKPVIHMFKTGHAIPFDVKLHRAIEFDYCNPQIINRTMASLSASIRDAMKEEHEVDNPVTRALGQKKIDLKAMPEIQLLREQISSLAMEVDRLHQAYKPPRHSYTPNADKWRDRTSRQMDIEDISKFIVIFDRDINDSLILDISRFISNEFAGLIKLNSITKLRHNKIRIDLSLSGFDQDFVASYINNHPFVTNVEIVR